MLPTPLLSLVLNGEALAFAGAGKLDDQLAEVRLFDLVEPAGAVFGGKAPRIRRSAHEHPYRIAVSEIDELYGDDLIDDARKLPAGFGAFTLQLPAGDIEIVDHLFENADEDHVHTTRMLQ